MSADSCLKCHHSYDQCRCALVTHEDLANETKTVMHYVAQQAETIRDQLYYLHKTHTLAVMAATLYGKTNEHAHVIAKNLYQKIELSLEKDRAIVGQIRSKHVNR